MGTLTNLNPPKPIADSDLPPEVTRDIEFILADAAHVNAADPHLQYATQARADARYGAIKKYYFTGTTASTQGGFVGIPHGLIASKILAINALVEHSGGLVSPQHTFTAGYEYSLSANSDGIYVGNVATKSANILSKPIRIVVDYLI